MEIMKVADHICSKCERAVQVPDWDDTEPFYKYFRRWERAVLKHGWLYHREDFPAQFTSFSQFMRWITTPEGWAWDEKQGVLIEAEEIIRTGKGS